METFLFDKLSVQNFLTICFAKFRTPMVHLTGYDLMLASSRKDLDVFLPLKSFEGNEQ